MTRTIPASIVLLLLAVRGDLLAGQVMFHLPIGDPARKGREVRVVPDTIIDTATGESLTPAQLAARLSDVRIVLVGESHTDIEFHRVQQRLLEELHRSGRPVLIGLEMYPYTQQPFLDQWVEGLLTEEGFLQLSRWYKNWGYHWAYYRDIFLLARSAGLRMFAINTPREVVSAVRKKGLTNLTAEEAAHIPAEVDTSSAEHRQLFKAFFADGDSAVHASSLPEEQWDAMFAAQCTWDATMGYNAVQALARDGRADAIMVVLVGSGHVAYGLGIQRQAARWFGGRMVSVIPVAGEDRKQRRVERIRASYADFVWGLPGEQEPLFPVLGVSMREGVSTLEVVGVEKDSPGALAGFTRGDVVIEMDGTPVPDKEALNRRMADKRWGDSAAFSIRRDGQAASLAVYFRRQP